MNVYLIHKLCRQELHDKAFRSALLEAPAKAIASMPFDEDARTALLEGDVLRLYRGGASPFLLLILCRFNVFGLDLITFIVACAWEHSTKEPKRRSATELNVTGRTDGS
jgi:hypothetical protein